MLENIDLREYFKHGNLCQVIQDNLLTGRSEIIVYLNMIYRSTSQKQRELKHCLRLSSVPAADQDWKIN